MAVRKLSGRYIVEFESRGHRIFRRLPTGATKAQAEELELKLRRELIDQAVLGKAPSVTLYYAVKAWDSEVIEKRQKSRREARSKVNLVLAGLEEAKLLQAPLQAAQEAAKGLVDLWEGLAPGTINRRLCVLKSACKWAWKVKRWTPHNLSPHIALLSGEVERTRTIDEPTIAKIIRKAVGKEAKAFIALGAYGLMRQSEVMRLQPEDIGKQQVRIRDWDDKIRTVSIVPQLRPHLKAVPLTLHKRTLYAAFEAARDAAEVEDLVYHDLRRSGATILLNRGVPLEVVSHILGHRDIETTRKVYAHVLSETVRKAMKRGFQPIKNPIRKGGPGGI